MKKPTKSASSKRAVATKSRSKSATATVKRSTSSSSKKTARPMSMEFWRAFFMGVMAMLIVGAGFNYIKGPGGADAAIGGGSFGGGSLGGSSNIPVDSTKGSITYYLDCVEGADTNNGLTQTTAFKTVSQAINTLNKTSNELYGPAELQIRGNTFDGFSCFVASDIYINRAFTFINGRDKLWGSNVGDLTGVSYRPTVVGNTSTSTLAKHLYLFGNNTTIKNIAFRDIYLNSVAKTGFKTIDGLTVSNNTFAFAYGSNLKESFITLAGTSTVKGDNIIIWGNLFVASPYSIAKENFSSSLVSIYKVKNIKFANNMFADTASQRSTSRYKTGGAFSFTNGSKVEASNNIRLSSPAAKYSYSKYYTSAITTNVIADQEKFSPVK